MEPYHNQPERFDEMGEELEKKIYAAAMKDGWQTPVVAKLLAQALREVHNDALTSVFRRIVETINQERH